MTSKSNNLEKPIIQNNHADGDTSTRFSQKADKKWKSNRGFETVFQYNGKLYNMTPNRTNLEKPIVKNSHATGNTSTRFLQKADKEWKSNREFEPLLEYDHTESKRPHDILYYVMKEKMKDPLFNSYLSDDETFFIADILDNHAYLVDMAYESVASIIDAHPVMDFKHIPEIVLELSRILGDHTIQQKAKEVSIISLIRFVVSSLLCSELFPTVPVKKSVFMNVVETSLVLLRFDIPKIVEAETACFSCFRRFFGFS
jgi:hypothetical protein